MKLSLSGLPGHDERVVLQSEESGQSAVEAMIDVRPKLNERRQTALVSQIVRDDRAEAGVRQRRIELVAGHHQVVGRRMAAVERIEVTHHGEPSQLGREVRHVLAELHARLHRVDHAELAPNFFASVRLGIERVVMTRPAARPDEDGVHVSGGMAGRRRCPSRFGLQQHGERKPHGGERADVDEKLAPAAFTVTIDSGGELQHGGTSLKRRTWGGSNSTPGKSSLEDSTGILGCYLMITRPEAYANSNRSERPRFAVEFRPDLTD